MVYTITVCAVCGAQAVEDREGDDVCPAHGFKATWTDLEVVRKDVADPVADQLRLEIALTPKHSPRSDKALRAYMKETIF